MRPTLLSAPLTLALTIAAVMPASAQDTSHPAGIYFGTCPEPGNALVTLWDTSSTFLVEGEADAGDGVGSEAGFPVEASVTTVEMPLADLVATEHAIVVHRSQSEMDDYLVCGDIGGPTLGSDELPVALAPVSVSPWSGVALLEDMGDDTTTVSLYVFEGPGIDTGAESASVGPFASPLPSVLRDAVTDQVVPGPQAFEDEDDDHHEKDKKDKDKKDHEEKHEAGDEGDHDDD
jgi:hypothetical protein